MSGERNRSLPNNGSVAQDDDHPPISGQPRRLTHVALRGSVAINVGRGNEEPTDKLLRAEYRRLEEAFLEGLERDRSDVNRALEREQKFTVEYNRMSTNRLWAKEDKGPVELYKGSLEDYMEGYKIWPRGRKLDDLSVYGQIWDFVRYMFKHTKPYSTVAMILLMSISNPIQTAMLGYVAQEIEKDPKGVPLWLYFTPFFAKIFDRFLYWWYEMWVPLNSQRVQMRSVLLSQRMELHDDHPVAKKWPSGRFNGLLKDVDEVINGIWQSALNIIDDIVSMTYILILCFLNLAWQFRDQEGAEVPDTDAYGAYVGIFLALGIVCLCLPFLWFYLFCDKVRECENMIRDGQALYMSASADAVAMGNQSKLFALNKSGALGDGADVEKGMFVGAQGTARKSFRVYGLTTFRAFFHRLAWQSNYSILVKMLGAIVAYALLTAEDFGQANLASTLIILVSLKELVALSSKLLDYLVAMCRGCDTLLDVAELLNSGMESRDVEEGNYERCSSRNGAEGAVQRAEITDGN